MKVSPILILLPLLAFITGACDGDDDNGPIEHGIVIQSLELSGTTTEAAAVTIDQQDDADATADTAWSASFTLEDRIGPSYLPLDDGSARTHVFDVKSVPTGAGEVGRTRVRIAIGD